MAKDKLNEKQKRFAAEYIIDLNGTQAAIRAGYAENSAAEQASDLLRNPNIAELIQKAMDKRAVRTQVTADRVLSELARLAFSNMEDFIDPETGSPKFKDLTRDQWASVQEITEDATGGSNDGERRLVLRRKFKLADKGQNLERIGRHLQLFTDKLAVSGDLTVSLSDEIRKARQRAEGAQDASQNE